jgi:uncharacterized RDD family membrane protein YckC
MQTTNLSEEENSQPDLLSVAEFSEIEYEYAGQLQRFGNFIIDNLLMNYGIGYISGFALGIIIGLFDSNFFDSYDPNNPSFALYFFMLLVVILNHLLYYTICEKLFKGRTLGKLITGTKAVRQDGAELTFRDALLRSLTRLVPFEAFSGFNTLCWHDSWTNTMVVKTR